MAAVQAVCNKRFGNCVVKEAYSGGVCAYTSKSSGYENAAPMYLGKW